MLKTNFTNISLSLIRSGTGIKCNYVIHFWSICIQFLNHCHHQKYTNRQFKMAFTWKPVVLWHCGLISYFSLENLQPFLQILPHKLQEKLLTFTVEKQRWRHVCFGLSAKRMTEEFFFRLQVASGGSNVSVGVENFIIKNHAMFETSKSMISFVIFLFSQRTSKIICDFKQNKT